MHHTKDKGDLGVLKAQVDLHEKGYIILIPLTEHSPFDLVAYKDGIFKRIQVKYRSVSPKGTLDVSFRSYWSNKDGLNVKKQDVSEFDVCCIYCPETDKCYYIDVSTLNDVYVSLRVKTPKKNFSDNRCRLADDFLKVP